MLRICCWLTHLQRHTLWRNRHYWKNMDCSTLQPPEHVRGMKELERDSFQKAVKVPRLKVREDQTNRVMPLIKKFLLKMEKLRPVQELKGDGVTMSAMNEILLHPLPVIAWDSLPIVELAKVEVTKENFYYDTLELSYENWRADEIFKSVLPVEEEGLTSYSRIGHIVHLNLRDHLLPYKQIIGDVLRDKVAGCRSVVNKANTIDNTYRNFQLELICGEPEYQVTTKENGIVFEFDFSRVYWNPRLSTEHDRIAQLLRPGDVLYDVFAGVGPFSVPAAKKGCAVLANDLNPESFRWLEHNAKRNKCQQRMQTFNKDGRDFILQDVKADLQNRWSETKPPAYAIHITMNLPAIAVEFVDAFRGLFSGPEHATLQLPTLDTQLPLVHVYCFAKGENSRDIALTQVEQHLGKTLEGSLEGVHFVRNVAPNKDMYRVSFRLTHEMLTKALDKTRGEDTAPLKRSTENDEAPRKVCCR